MLHRSNEKQDKPRHGVEANTLKKRRTPLFADWLTVCVSDIRQNENWNTIKYFDQAVKIDPQFALAWAWLDNRLSYLIYLM